MVLAYKMITVSLKLYKALIRDSEILNALYAGGVDNWEWYSASLEDANVGGK